MKKAIGIAVVLLLACAVMASATETNWQLQIKASDTANMNFNTTLSVGCQATFTDLADGIGKGEPTAPSSPGPGSTIATVAAILSDGSLSVRDFKQPITEPGSTEAKNWIIKIFTMSSDGPALSPVKVLVTPRTGTIAPVYTINGKPYLYVFSGAYEAVYDAAHPMPASFSFEVPGAPLANAAELLITARVVPEPGSLLALGSGLVGLVGFAIRRRR